MNFCLTFLLLLSSSLLTLSSGIQEQNHAETCQNNGGSDSKCKYVDSNQATDTNINKNKNDPNDVEMMKDVLVFPDGGIYSGDVVNGKQEGNGREETATGDRYDGEWKGGIKCGVGKYKWKDGRSYRGQSVAFITPSSSIHLFPHHSITIPTHHTYHTIPPIHHTYHYTTMILMCYKHYYNCTYQLSSY